MPASHALIKGILVALKVHYLVADEMGSSHSTNRRQCAMMELLLTIKEAGEDHE
ncbi:MAG: hypothetical protein KZQ95_22315 [Candidatus Thiodiazotropha sp. (ex Epidulcina cf. delphinae)]|nr:hypothetical protein [Candidatus Thiodiazotropha sp. (ex Epidulcina cf. delphinae)]